jgi:AmiR/NasT family two-component response regulator
VDSDPAKIASIASQTAVVVKEFEENARRFHEVSSRLQENLEQLQQGRPHRQALRESVLARMQARLTTMPVIEQAKGVLMAQYSCGPDEAFDLLRRASQSANVKVSVLAVRIVEQTAAGRLGALAADSAG